MKKMLGIVFLICLFATPALADGWTDGWTVKRVRNYNGEVQIFVTDGTTNKTFILYDDLEFEKQGMALALSAMSMDAKLKFGAFNGGKPTLIDVFQD